MDYLDTQVMGAGSDTRMLSVSPGQPVQIAAGDMNTCKGIAIERRAMGRILVRLTGGVYAEIHQFCLEPIEKPWKSNASASP